MRYNGLYTEHDLAPNQGGNYLKFEILHSSTNHYRTDFLIPPCTSAPISRITPTSGTVLRNLPSVQWFVSAQVLQHALATAPGRLQPISVPALATHAPATARPLFIEPIHRTVLRYTFLPFSPFSSVFSLQMPELLAVLNEPNSLPHLVPGTPPFPLSLLLPPLFCPYSHEDRKL